jgi:hypothetical protein
MEYVGYNVSARKTSASRKRVEVVAYWPLPTVEKVFCSFVHFSNFYAKSNYHISNLTAPLTGLPRKSQPHKVVLTHACRKAFKTLLVHFRAMPNPAGC